MGRGPNGRGRRHDALVDLSGKELLEAPDNFPLGHPLGAATRDVVDSRLVVTHPDYDGSVKGGIGLAVATPGEAVPDREAGAGRDGAGAAELGKRRFGAHTFVVVAENNEHLGRGVSADPEPLPQCRRVLGGQLVQYFT